MWLDFKVWLSSGSAHSEERDCFVFIGIIPQNNIHDLRCPLGVISCDPYGDDIYLDLLSNNYGPLQSLSQCTEKLEVTCW